jgi:hypothetical protein
LEVSENKLVKFLYGNFQKGIVPKITIDFKYTNVHTTTDVTQKPLKIIGLEDKVFERFMASQALNTVQGLNSLEKNLSKLLGIPEEALIIVPPFSKARFEPQDIHVYSREGNIRLLSQIYPNHFHAMQEYGRSHLSFRIGVLDDYRRKVYDQAEKVKEFLLESLDKAY